jgi:hypothetical protein
MAMTADEVVNAAKEWPTDKVEQVIAELAKLRAGMEPAVITEFKPGQAVTNVTTTPRWHTQRERLQGLSLLHFRHPGLGWLHFAIPPREAVRLAKLLFAQAKITKEKEQSKRVSN